MVRGGHETGKHRRCGSGVARFTTANARADSRVEDPSTRQGLSFLHALHRFHDRRISMGNCGVPGSDTVVVVS